MAIIKDFKKKEFLYIEGDESEYVYIVISGDFKVSKVMFFEKQKKECKHQVDVISSPF